MLYMYNKTPTYNRILKKEAIDLSALRLIYATNN